MNQTEERTVKQMKKVKKMKGVIANDLSDLLLQHLKA